jgi:hypothetical protein
MKRGKGRPRPPRSATAASLPGRISHSTVPKKSGSAGKPPLRLAKPPRTERHSLVAPPARPPRRVARIVDEDEASLLDLIDNLIGKGVMLNADLILALANVDLVYVRLSALLCAADRVLPQR